MCQCCLIRIQSSVPQSFHPALPVVIYIFFQLLFLTLLYSVHNNFIHCLVIDLVNSSIQYIRNVAELSTKLQCTKV